MFSMLTTILISVVGEEGIQLTDASCGGRCETDGMEHCWGEERGEGHSKKTNGMGVSHANICAQNAGAGEETDERSSDETDNDGEWDR